MINVGGSDLGKTRVDQRRPLVAELVGRNEEAARLKALVSALAEGRGGTALIEGPPGIGKTRLIEYILQLASRAGATTAFGSADPLGARRPFHAVVSIVSSLQGDGPDSADQLTRYLDMISGRAEPTALIPPGSARVQVIETLIAELEQRARSPLLLVVEDLHWADDASLSTLRAAVRLTSELPLLIVASARSGVRSDADASLRSALMHTGGLIRPAELEKDDVTELLAALIAAQPGPRLSGLAERAGGNPLLVTELVCALDQDGMLFKDGPAIEVREEQSDAPLLDVVTRRIRVLPEDTLQVLQAGAVLGRDFTVRELAALTGQSAASLVKPIESAVAAGLLVHDSDRFRFEHGLLRDAIYAELPAPLQTALHHDAARVLAEFGASAVTVATHAALGAAQGDADAVRWLREAAEDIMSLTPEAALAMLDEALILSTTEPEVQRSVQRARVESLMGVGRLDEAARLAEHLLDGWDDTAGRADLRTRLAGLLILLNRPTAAIVQLDMSADEAQGSADRALAQAYGSLARLATADLEGAASLARDAAELADKCGDARARTLAASVLGRLPCLGHGYADGMRTALTAVASAEADPTNESHGFLPWFWVGVIGLDLDQQDRVDSALREGRRRADADYSAWAHPLYCGLAASWHYRRGDLDDARAEAETSVSLALDTGSRQALMWSQCILALTAHMRGETSERDQWALAAESSFERGNAQLGIDFLALVQSLAMPSEDACNHLGDAWDLFEAIKNRNCQPLLAIALTRVAVTHEPTRASDIEAALHRAATRTQLPSLAGIEHHVAGLIRRDVATLVRAADLFAGCQRRLDKAGALADAAHVAATNNATDANRLGLAAVTEFEACGARGAASALTSRLQAHGVELAPARRAVSGWESLTPTEAAVVTLLAEGLTNSEIAARRTVSRRTVESHLQRVYTKLGYSSRVRLAVEAAERSPVSGR